MSQNDPNGRLLVILNPASGSMDDDYRKRIEDALAKHGIDFEVRETSKEKDGKALAEEARKEGVNHVAACGGDGTVMAVVNGLGPNQKGEPAVILSIIPGGTANLLATALQIPSDPEEAVAVAVNGKDRDIDLGQSNDSLFALGIGVGVTERFVSQASTEAKEKIGRWAYLLALLKELGAKPNSFTLQLDDGKDVPCRGVAVVIANVGELGKGMHFVPDAQPDDGLLDVCVLHRFEMSDLFRLGMHAIFGGLKNDRAITFYKASSVKLTAVPPLEVQIDGEPVEAKTPITAKIFPKALRVRVPSDQKQTPSQSHD